MSTTSAPLQPLSRLRLKYLLFAFIGLMILYVLRHNERFLVDATDPVWRHYQAFKWWLLPHGLAGACALLLGPIQFSDRLRLRFAKLHRVVGRFYVVGVFIAAPLGFYIQYFQERMGASRSFSFAAALDAIFVDADNRHRFCVHSQRQSPTAPSMDDPQLSGCLGLSRSARDPRYHRLGKSWRIGWRNGCVDLPWLLTISRRCCLTGAGASPHSGCSCEGPNRFAVGVR